jgi:hypothetical protein
VIDAPKAIRDFLVDQASLAVTAVHAERNEPPPGYKPASDGMAICFRIRGGNPETQESGLIRASVQFKCYGRDEMEANECYRSLYDALHQKRGAQVRWAHMEVPGQTLREPETQWVFVLTYFTVYVA